MKKLMLTFLATILFLGVTVAQKNQIPLIGSHAPSFTAKSTNGTVKFPDDFGKDWKILFSHPQDFTPVCSSELLELAYMQKDFDRLGVKIAVISTDDVDQHNLWKAHLEELDYKGRGTQKINFPILDDSKATASKTYGLLHEPTSSNKDIRGVFIIDSENTVRSINFYPMQVGRNMKEIMRIVEALQTTSQTKVLTPANWTKGDDVMVPYFPYTKAQLAANPALEKEYYNVGNRMWFKKVGNNTQDDVKKD
ncbi:MAG: redoxin domain-containing protein [Bacteroidetes bacterium]|nr:redoxin domain-containing protein [Bacteroidota bacterium]